VQCIRILKFLLVLLLCELLCESFIYSPLYSSSLVHAEQLLPPSRDLVAPEITHEPNNTIINAGNSKTISVSVTDNVGIQSVTLFYRVIGSNDYNRISMQTVMDSNEYQAEIVNLEVPGIEYYLQAIDLAGNALTNGHAISPLVVSVTATNLEAQQDIASTSNNAAEAISQSASTSELSKKTWVWIGLGILAAGAALSLTDGGGSGNPPPPTSTVVIDTPIP